MLLRLLEWLLWPQTAIAGDCLSSFTGTISHSSLLFAFQLIRHHVVISREPQSNQNKSRKSGWECLWPTVAKDIPWNMAFLVICASVLWRGTAEKSRCRCGRGVWVLGARLGSFSLYILVGFWGSIWWKVVPRGLCSMKQSYILAATDSPFNFTLRQGLRSR